MKMKLAALAASFVLAAVLAACGFPENVRGETLGIPEFGAITNEILRREAEK